MSNKQQLTEALVSEHRPTDIIIMSGAALRDISGHGNATRFDSRSQKCQYKSMVSFTYPVNSTVDSSMVLLHAGFHQT